MSFCINPQCPNPHNQGSQAFCASCGSGLLLAKRFWVTQLLSDNSGFGVIYEAYDTKNLPKILKVLMPHHNNNAKVIELFQQEAQILQNLNCSGIPRIDEYFEHSTRAGSLHCIVMEKVDGINLEEELRKYRNKPIAQETALAWLEEIVGILDVVHKANYFHRDIKPANIMLRRSGKLVLIDFGTARDISATYMAKLPQGRVTGISSAGYTPPEQVNHGAVPQSDFFALGRTFAHLLTGKAPMDMYDPHKDEFRWRQYVNPKDVSPIFLDLIDRMMARQVINRPQDTAQLLQEVIKVRDRLKPRSGSPIHTIIKKLATTITKTIAVGVTPFSQLTKITPTRRKTMNRVGIFLGGILIALSIAFVARPIIYPIPYECFQLVPKV